MDKEKSKEMLTNLLSAFSTEDVQKILDKHRFKDSDWLPYGGREKNWDTISNQQTNAVGALTELITNSIDAILCRKAYEKGINDLSGHGAPKSMQEAVRLFYKVDEGKLSSLEPRQRTELAEKTILIGIKRKRKGGTTPTITVVDFGEGQSLGDFEKTFLSLSETNKEGIGFVQGKFNMGSTGSIRFCTEADITKGHYKLIASRRYDSNVWGWTLIKVFQVEKGRKLPIVKYLKPDGEIPSFEAESIAAFDHNKVGNIKKGSIVRLFDYDVGQGPHQVDLGMYEALTLNLLDCALPVRLYDFDAKKLDNKGELRSQGIADRTFSGMDVMLCADITNTSSSDPPIPHKKPDKRTTEFVHLISEDYDDELGKVRVVATGVSELPNALQRTKKRIFYTINGQTHAAENASFLNTKDVGLGDLRNHIIVNIQCEDMDKTALTMFMGNREQIIENRLSGKLKKKVKKFLKEDSKLKEYQNIIRLRRASQIVEENEETKKLLSNLVTQDPAIRELLGLGNVVVGPTLEPGLEINQYEGSRFPTFLKPLNVSKDNNGNFIKELPINTIRKIECGTDAANDYLTRHNSPGWIYISPPNPKIKRTVKLRNGTATFTFSPPSQAQMGEELSFNIGFDDHGPRNRPLIFPLTIKFVEEEPPRETGGEETDGTRRKNKESIADPIEWVQRDDWKDFEFDEKSGAAIRLIEDKIKIHVNRDHETLNRMRINESDEARRKLNENRFRICLGLLTLAVYKHYDDENKKNESNADEKSEETSKAIAPYILSLIATLGEGQKL